MAGHVPSRCDSIWKKFVKKSYLQVHKKVTFKFTFLVLSALIVNVPFCHEDGGGELWKLDILIVVS